MLSERQRTDQANGGFFVNNYDIEDCPRCGTPFAMTIETFFGRLRCEKCGKCVAKKETDE